MAARDRDGLSDLTVLNHNSLRYGRRSPMKAALVLPTTLLLLCGSPGCASTIHLKVPAQRDCLDRSVMSKPLDTPSAPRVLLVAPAGLDVSALDKALLLAGAFVVPYSTGRVGGPATSLLDAANNAKADVIFEVIAFSSQMGAGRRYFVLRGSSDRFDEAEEAEFSAAPDAKKKAFISDLVRLTGRILSGSDAELLASLDFECSSNRSLPRDWLIALEDNGHDKWEVVEQSYRYEDLPWAKLRQLTSERVAMLAAQYFAPAKAPR